ncbi:MAG TPA: methyltransferase, TIGR04325 family [Waddliaceae bacterium]
MTYDTLRDEFFYRIKRYFGPRWGYSGDYSSIESIKDRTSWDDERIFNEFKNSLRLVKSGDALFERDGKPVRKPEVDRLSFPLLSSLLYIAAAEKRLDVLDYGGGSGSTYWHYGKYIPTEKYWTVSDQQHIIDYCKIFFIEKDIKFIEEHDSIFADVFLISSVLHYLEKPYELLTKIDKEHKYKYILIARTTITNRDRLTKQTVNPKIYPMRFPVWFLSRTKVPETFSNYEVIFHWEDEPITTIGNIGGWLFKRK